MASRKECDKLRQMGDALVKKVARAEQKRKEAEEELLELRRRYRQMKASSDELRAQEKISSTFESEKLLSSRIREETSSLRAAKEKALQQLVTQTDRAEKLKQATQDLANEASLTNASLRGDLDSVRCDAERLQRQLRRSSQSAEILKRDYKVKSELIVKLGSENEFLKGEKERLENMLARSDEEKRQLLSHINDLQQEVAALRDLCDDAGGRVPNLERQASDWQEEARGLRGALSRVQAAFDHTKREREHWKQQSLKATRDFAEMDERVAELTMKLKAVELENARLSSRRDPNAIGVQGIHALVVSSPRIDDEEEDMEWQQLTERMAAIASGS
ncbi:hypothetical protein FOL47_008340 [Perkinsus chesapeaki]|uniref:Uncharacterized protein n=1 Tax=Perkinsus chesapeaki TaxID=330153 RepID=A0A7J6MTW4_PERCH|nr:hypothetical protein FOL47_008340 [Perkinsus chesapeaki]